jgi:Helicase conserved C-terminal domain
MTYVAPFDLKPFQVDLVVQGLAQDSLCIGADCGAGKTAIALCVACMLLDDGQVDHVLLECEKGKLDEWETDLRTFTRASVGVLSGGPQRRAEIIANPPQILVGTYETVRGEIARPQKLTKAGREYSSLQPGPLAHALAGKRILLVWDEATAKIGADRGSAMYRHHELFLKFLRKHGQVRVMPTTATVVDRDPEGWFNLARLMDPGAAGRVQDFESYHVGRDRYGKAIVFKCLTPEDCPPGAVSLQEKIGHLAVFKSKFDPDISRYFPKIAPPIATYVDLSERHQEFYEVIAQTDDDHKGDWQWNRQLFGVLRQIAGHPLSLVRSVEMARAEKRDLPQVASLIVREVGERGLEALGAAKLDVLVERLQKDVRDAQAVVFTFYGQSILPLIEERLVKEGFEVVVNHGGLSYAQRRRARVEFKEGAQIFLSSDAGCRGINLPEAQWVFNYEMPLTHSKWWQRINRANRLDSLHPVTYVNDLIVRDTIEDGIVGLGLKRHAWSDNLTDDSEDGSNYLSADIRKRLMKISRKQGA